MQLKRRSGGTSPKHARLASEDDEVALLFMIFHAVGDEGGDLRRLS